MNGGMAKNPRTNTTAKTRGGVTSLPGGFPYMRGVGSEGWEKIKGGLGAGKK
jgi:hypothetical protein